MSLSLFPLLSYASYTGPIIIRFLHQFYYDEGMIETNDTIDWKLTKCQKLSIFSALLNSHNHCILDVPISLLELKY